jgi:hypothetical protein
MKRSFAALLLLLAAPWYGSGADLAQLMPPDPAMMAGARLRALLDSETVRGAASPALAVDPRWRELANSIGFDPLKDVDEVLMAATGTGDNPPFLIAAHGRFRVGAAAVLAQPYRGVPLLDAGHGSAIAFLDAETALMGDAAEVRAAIDRREAVGDPAVPARIAELRSRYDIWGFGKQPAGFLPGKSAPSGLDGVDRFEVGVLLTQGLELTADLHFTDLKAAAELSRGISQLRSLFMGTQPTAAGLKMDARMNGNVLRFALSVPDSELRRALSTQKIASASWRDAGPAAPRDLAPPPAAAAPPKPSGPPSAIPLVISAPLAPVKTGEAPSVFRLPGGR